MKDREIIAEILNMKKYNYTLADNEVFEKAIQGIKVLSAIEDIKAEIEQARYGLINDGLDVALKIIDKHIGGE